MKFTNKDELIEQARKDGACKTGIEFAKSCKDLQEIFETIDKNMLLWCIRKGYEQFTDNCDWSKLNGYDWSYLLRAQPQFVDCCDWDKLIGRDWSRLLEFRPQFSYRCDWDKLTDLDWSNLLEIQPQLASYQK